MSLGLFNERRRFVRKRLRAGQTTRFFRLKACFLGEALQGCMRSGKSADSVPSGQCVQQNGMAIQERRSRQHCSEQVQNQRLSWIIWSANRLGKQPPWQTVDWNRLVSPAAWQASAKQKRTARTCNPGGRKPPGRRRRAAGFGRALLPRCGRPLPDWRSQR